jgi:hypothetical protein
VAAVVADRRAPASRKLSLGAPSDQVQAGRIEIRVPLLARSWAWGSGAATLAGLVTGVVLGSAEPRSSAVVSFNGADGLGWLMFVGSSVHVAFTACLFGLPGVRSVARRHRWRCSWAPVGLIAVAAVISLLISPPMLAWGLLAVFSWQFWHYQKQNLGIVALAAASHLAPRLKRGERRAMKSAGAAGVGGLLAHPGLLGLQLRLPVAGLWTAALALFVISSGWGLLLLARRPRPDRPANFSALYVASLLFWAPMFSFRSPYAAVGGMTIAHGLQYLLLGGLVMAGAEPGRGVRTGLALNAALVGGALLSWASHLHGSPIPLRVLFGAYVGVLMAHFVVDAGLWRLRDPAARTFLGARVPALLPAGAVPVADGSAGDVA